MIDIDNWQLTHTRNQFHEMQCGPQKRLGIEKYFNMKLKK